MRILIDIGHPAHVHLFKNMVWNMKNHGHQVQIVARQKDVTLDLLRLYGLEYESRGEIYNSLFDKAIGVIRINYRLYNIVKKFNPDILIGVHNPYLAHVGKLIGKPSISFNDTENVKITSTLTYPFADVVITPLCFREKVPEKKHVTFNGYKELAYLHPKYFTPDPGIVTDIGLSEGEPYILLRFISWAASHDINLQGIKPGSEKAFIESLEKYGKIFITSERTLPAELEKYQLNVSPDKIHSLLYYARLYIGEGGTMATEAAILGTPAIHIEASSSGKASGELSGNFLELRDLYGLLYFYADQEHALKKALEILSNPNSKKIWQKKREKLLQEKIDVTAWLIDFVERYPESFHEYMARKKPYL